MGLLEFVLKITKIFVLSVAKKLLLSALYAKILYREVLVNKVGEERLT
jgi:hypothetical protein